MGWFYVMDPGEKVAAAYDIVNEYALYSTFVPTVACGTGSAVCTTAAKGIARLHVRHYLTGSPLDWNEDGAYDATDAYASLGEGVPRAPAVSSASSKGESRLTVIGGGSNSGIQAMQVTNLGADLVSVLQRFPVSKEMHEYLHY
jgi:hypothetical protein